MIAKSYAIFNFRSSPAKIPRNNAEQNIILSVRKIDCQFPSRSPPLSHLSATPPSGRRPRNSAPPENFGGDTLSVQAGVFNIVDIRGRGEEKLARGRR